MSFPRRRESPAEFTPISLILKIRCIVREEIPASAGMTALNLAALELAPANRAKNAKKSRRDKRLVDYVSTTSFRPVRDERQVG